MLSLNWTNKCNTNKCSSGLNRLTILSFYQVIILLYADGGNPDRNDLLSYSKEIISAVYKYFRNMWEKIPFIVSARTARLIWQENFSNTQWAIIELVKNSYDADADSVLVIFEYSKNSQSYEKIYIIDNWLWMTEEVIKEKWMKIGTDDKLIDYISWKWRIKSGAKWIGRFALDRLWRSTIMRTKVKDAPSWLQWSVNWEDFDSPSPINNIQAEIEKLENFSLASFLQDRFAKNTEILQRIKDIDFSRWTILEISRLRDSWSDDLTVLFNDLELLIPPKEQPQLSLSLNSTQHPDKYGQITWIYYDDYDYKVAVKYLSDEKKVEISITRNELDINLLKKEYSDLFAIDLMKKNNIDIEKMKNKAIKEVKTIKDFSIFKNIDEELLKKVWTFDFTYYYIKNKADQEDEIYPYRNFNSAERSSWLKRFGGVKIFRDNFRVRPYWENGEDWLRLWERQGQSPSWAWQRLGGYRIRPNQISGTIHISRIFNEHLADKSGREWIIENDVFELFRNIIIEFINIFEVDRNTVMHSLKLLQEKLHPAEKAKNDAIKLSKKIRKSGGKNKSKWKKGAWNKKDDTSEEKILSDWVEALKDELDGKKHELMMLRNLASTWLIVSSFAHELKKYTKYPKAEG